MPEKEPRGHLTKKDIEAIAQAVQAALKKPEPAEPPCGEHCKEQCGITPSEHFEAHRKVNEFFTMLTNTGQTIWGSILKAIVALIVGLLLIGLGIKIDKFF